MPRSFPTPADPRQPHPGGCSVSASGNTNSITVCFIIIDGAVSSFRECGLPYGLRDSLCTLQPFRSALTSPPHGCNTRYEWLVSPYPTGTFTQLETPSFAWRTSVLICTTGCQPVAGSFNTKLEFQRQLQQAGSLLYELRHY